MNLFRDYGLSKLVNALGTSTFVGASRVSQEVIGYMESVLTQSVDMRQLQALASEVIKKHTGAEAGCVTGCSAAGIAVGSAAFLTGDDLASITAMPKPVQGPRGIVIQKAHLISGGGCSVELLIRLCGAEINEVGEAADCALFQLHAALDQKVVGAVYIMSPRANTPGTIPLQTFIDACHEHGVPVLVDAAGQVNIKSFIEKGADLVVASAQKWLGGPTAGLIAGRRDLVHACFLHGEFGIGRPMKVGKEGIAGLIGALETYADRTSPDKTASQHALLDHLAALLEGEPGLTLKLIDLPAGAPFTRILRIDVDPNGAGLHAWALSHRLIHGSPRIAVDAYNASEGYIAIVPALLDPGDENVIAKRIQEELLSAQQNPAAPHDYEPRFQTLVSHMQAWREEFPVWQMPDETIL